MNTRPALLIAFLLSACGSTPEIVLDLSSDPVGAQVYLSRRGERTYRGQLGPVKGDVKAESLEEDFFLIGTAPLVYTSPLEERDGGVSVLGVGGAVVLEYDEGVLRFEKEGFESVERRVRFRKGRVRVEVQMGTEPPPTAE